LNQIFPLTEKLREELKQPLGKLIPDSQVSMRSLEPHFHEEKILTVCVGDRTTERVHELGFSPRLEIVDSLEKRMVRNPPPNTEQRRRMIRVTNPPGTISKEALSALARCLVILTSQSTSRMRIQVTGEEDLFALPVIGYYPEDTVTMYGQPNEGLVITTGAESRAKARAMLSELGIFSLG
jgi:GTP-dependent dephospho-CoA kinase